MWRGEINLARLTMLVDIQRDDVFETIQTLLAVEDIEITQVEAGGGQVKRQVNELTKRTFHYYVVDLRSLANYQAGQLPNHSYVIVLLYERDFENIRSLLGHQVGDVLVWPEEQHNLAKLIAQTSPQIEKREQAELFTFTGKGKVISFYSAKGGSGKTFLSSLFAQCLAVEHDKQIMLIDLNVQAGGLEVILGVESLRTYVDLNPVLDELSIHHVQNIAVQEISTGIDLLLSPVNPEKMGEITEELISKLIRVAKTHYDYVLLDLPNALDSISFTALNESAEIFYILNPDSLSLRVFKHTLRVLEKYQLNHRDQVSVLLNLEHPKQELTEKDLAKLIDTPIIGAIRSDYFAVQSLLNMGSPFFKKKGSYLKAKPIKDMLKLVKNYETKVKEHVLVKPSRSLAKA